jgi:hypothetical protein
MEVRHMRVSLLGIALSLIVLTLAVGPGCRGDTPASLEPEGDLTGINIFNVPSTMRPGQVHAVGATGLYVGLATFPITAYASWSTSDAKVIELIGKGILRAVGGGTATITCSYRGVTSKPVEITVEGPPIPGGTGPEPVVLASIQVEPTWTSVAIGGTIQFTATAIYSNGGTQVVTLLVDWRVSDDDPGFIIDADNAQAWGTDYGLFRATGPVGTTVVSCEYQGVVSNYVTVVVREF